MNDDPTSIAQAIAKKLENAWNAADGTAFAQDFAKDADFVNISGEYHASRKAIAAGHQAIFETIYKGSVNRYEVLQARFIAPDVLIAQARSHLNAPSGPLAGENNSVFTMVATRQGGAWQLEAFHNTLVRNG